MDERPFEALLMGSFGETSSRAEGADVPVRQQENGR